MDFFNQHIESVKTQASSIKPPSKLIILFFSLLIIFSLIVFVFSILFFIIGAIVSIFNSEIGFLFSIAKYGFLFAVIAFFVSIHQLRGYIRKVAAFKNTTVLRKEFKQEILPKIIASNYQNVYYKFDGIVSEKHITDADFFSSNLLSNLNERWFFGDDYFKGRFENVEYEFCELYYKTEGLTTLGWGVVISIALAIIFSPLGDFGESFDIGGGDGGGEERSKKTENTNQKVEEQAFFYGAKTNFRGFFLYADFHKDFEGEVRIRTKKKFSFSKLFNFSDKNLKKIKPENSIIDKKYSIMATDVQMGYYVLSPVIIEAIENLNQRLGSNLSITLKNGKLYLIAPMSKDYFENITIEKNKIEPNTLENILNDLKIIKNLLLEFNLENRIWTKK